MAKKEVKNSLEEVFNKERMDLAKTEFSKVLKERKDAKVEKVSQLNQKVKERIKSLVGKYPDKMIANMCKINLATLNANK